MLQTIKPFLYFVLGGLAFTLVWFAWQLKKRMTHRDCKHYWIQVTRPFLRQTPTIPTSLFLIKRLSLEQLTVTHRQSNKVMMVNLP